MRSSGHVQVMRDTSDDVLWRRTVRGDRDAFAEIFDRHARRIYGFCFRQTADWAVAQDLTSITFLEAWRRRNSALIDEGKVLAWLFGVAYNTVRQQRRSLRRYREALERLPVPTATPDHTEDSAARAAAEREAAELLQKIRRLPSAQRAALSLVMWEGLTPAEVAVALDKPEATVRSSLHRARRTLRTDTDTELAPRSPISFHEGTGSR
jgi:RNA polymerase sigma factor (sigma-70 family)